MRRRQFLQTAALGTGATMITIGTQGWALRAQALVPTQQNLIVVFLRGAVDGLNVVVPHGEPNYFSSRPTIAIPQPGQAGGALNLDSHFGLHPALAPLMPLWQHKTLAFVHACGSPDPNRSHFEAQEYMENGTPGITSTPDGWMNRLLASLGVKSPLGAISIGATTPRILSGRMPVANLPSGKMIARPLPVDRPAVAAAFSKLYQGTSPIDQAYQEGVSARRDLIGDLEAEMTTANNGAPPVGALASDARHLGDLMAQDSRIRLGFLAAGGWDTHVRQGASQGLLADQLKGLGEGLATLVQALGPVYQRTTILVMSEFGRTVHENGNGGTDHGHGNVMWLLGGRVQGGKVYGPWPGLEPEQLYQDRDLAITTDFRDVIDQVLTAHLELRPSDLRVIFPHYTAPSQPLGVV